MAKQNIINGGFRGKLGNVVGKGWKNVSVIQTYNPTNNSKSEGQLKCRGNFKMAIKAGVKAGLVVQNIYYFESNKMTQLNMRTRLAMDLIKAGEKNLDILPLVPREVITAFSITGMEIKSVGAEKELTFSVSGTLPDEDLTLKCFICKKENVLDIENLMLVNAEYTAGEEKTIKIKLPNGIETGDEIYMRFFYMSGEKESDKILCSKTIYSDGQSAEEIDVNVTWVSAIRKSETEVYFVTDTQGEVESADDIRIYPYFGSFYADVARLSYKGSERSGDFQILKYEIHEEDRNFSLTQANNINCSFNFVSREPGKIFHNYVTNIKLDFATTAGSKSEVEKNLDINNFVIKQRYDFGNQMVVESTPSQFLEIFTDTGNRFVNIFPESIEQDGNAKIATYTKAGIDRMYGGNVLSILENNMSNQSAVKDTKNGCEIYKEKSLVAPSNYYFERYFALDMKTGDVYTFVNTPVANFIDTLFISNGTLLYMYKDDMGQETLSGTYKGSIINVRGQEFFGFKLARINDWKLNSQQYDVDMALTLGGAIAYSKSTNTIQNKYQQLNLRQSGVDFIPINE